MDDRFGGRTNRRKFILNDFYNQNNGNFYIFGGSNLQYRLKLLAKHIEKMYRNNLATIVFFNMDNNSFNHQEFSNMILHTKQQLKDTQNKIILIDQKYPYYHPILGIDFNDLIKVIDRNDDLLHDESAYLDAILTIMKVEKVPFKLHSIMEYTNLSLDKLINKCDYLINNETNNQLKQDLKDAKAILEEEQITRISSAPVRKLLKKLEFSITDITNKYCHYSISNAVKQRQIICINLANGTKDLMEYFQKELSYIGSSYHVILFDVNCSLSDDFENQMINTNNLSIYSSNFNRDFSNVNQNAILGKQNTTLLFKMQSGTATPIVDYYGEHDYYFKLQGHGSGHGVMDIFHLRDTRYTNYQTHRERVNKIEGEHVASLMENFECFEINGNDIVYHNNVSFEGV